ncbi:lipopolysaccharide assembly protein LapA domain-containing protein [Pseudonocardia bannensis]|uniref:lipopolysaccharide assembly protein LapA domain-containing protein n=1 Tax=Pseudonocardia bannensis TaxID=630973 RepID=UPI001FECEF14|nr:LapA family protein [Pseudonocardia bannensis]
MSDDRSRRGEAGPAGGPPAYGSVGPADPHADPATDPALRPATVAPDGGPTMPLRGGTAPDAAGDAPTRPVPTGVNRTRVSGLWVGLILSALVLLLLLIFILQNLGPVQVNFLGATGTLPTGVALLLAAIAGVLLVAIPGTGRIIQLRRAARRGADRGR